ncbi:hypothetical protein PGTUg99_025998 [Puccinia graminis f. sp. tritici]|uniref:Uncharacterized protein n=1 Tax=Puccinia graminis f. sp. tritici TaxID=56615 RepID=A0A5B0SEZ7_PUCGR|nr:hypothetical protein PGTUg99_025998 [Puccinia graminis f. sp. tritici]
MSETLGKIYLFPNGDPESMITPPFSPSPFMWNHMSAQSTTGVLLPWDTAGVNSGPSTITTLLQWLSRNNNYDQWCLGPIKRAICDEIVMQMNHHTGVLVFFGGIAVELDLKL